MKRYEGDRNIKGEACMHPGKWDDRCKSKKSARKIGE